jgi:GDP-L-fucose synthase
MPTNLYGPNDNFDLEDSHVVPAMIRKFHDAKKEGKEEVVLWGTGSAKREFLHVDDLAEASLSLMEKYNGEEILNVGMGKDLSIKQLGLIVKDITGYKGDIVFDSSKPDGTPRKLLDISRIKKLGWAAKIPLREGIESTYKWFMDNIDKNGRLRGL